MQASDMLRGSGLFMLALLAVASDKISLGSVTLAVASSGLLLIVVCLVLWSASSE